jgi:hypothetical protein
VQLSLAGLVGYSLRQIGRNALEARSSAAISVGRRALPSSPNGCNLLWLNKEAQCNQKREYVGYKFRQYLGPAGFLHPFVLIKWRYIGDHRCRLRDRVESGPLEVHKVATDW